MSRAILIVFLAGLCLRLLTLAISMRNERRLKSEGAVEHGRRNSLTLAVLHAAFYLAALAEGIVDRVQWDAFVAAGCVLYALSFLALSCVIRQLAPLWTVKLIIARGHPLNRGFLFRRIRHPNYYLNVIPELFGLALLMKAWVTAGIILPPYLVALAVRIRQEERAMRDACPDY